MSKDILGSLPGQGNEDLPSGEKTVVNSFSDLLKQSNRWNEIPHEDMVTVIKNSVVQERKKFEYEQSEFEPAICLSSRLMEHRLAAEAATGLRFNRPLINLINAWDAISRPYITDDNKRFHVGTILVYENAVEDRKITLDTGTHRVLTAMADAMQIPVNREERDIDMFMHVDLDEFEDGDDNPLMEIKTPGKDVESKISDVFIREIGFLDDDDTPDGEDIGRSMMTEYNRSRLSTDEDRLYDYNNHGMLNDTEYNRLLISVKNKYNLL